MTLKIYIGTVDEITARLAGAPNATETTVASAESARVFTLASASSFSTGDSIVVGKQKGVIESLNGAEVTLIEALGATPAIGATVRHYDADYTPYRNQAKPFVFSDDQRTGGKTGQVYGQDLSLFDYDGLMPDVVAQNRITIFDSADAGTSLFAGVIVASQRVGRTKTRDGVIVFEWVIEAEGYQWEADSVGIDELPFVNVNAGKFLNYLRGKWTTLLTGEIDTENSPTINYIRLANQRRFSQVGFDLAGLWAGSEFFIGNTHTGGAVYFRQQQSSFAPITLSSAYQETIGNREDQYITIRKDYDKVFNIVQFPYYRETWRDPDFHVQSTVADDAFLKSSVTLAGQPASIEEAVLFFDDFADGELSSDFLEYDVDNPSPPDGFNSADGFLIEGELNGVTGLHMLDGSPISAGYPQGGNPVGRLTEPSALQPFSGQEGQILMAKEVVVNQKGYGMVLGVFDQSTIQTVVASGSTTTVIQIVDQSDPPEFWNPCLITINGETRWVASTTNGSITISTSGFGALSSAPQAGDIVEVHRLSISRVKFGVWFTPTNITYIKDGVTYFPAPWAYTTATYSLRLFMQCFETTISGGISSTGCTLADDTDFSDDDVVEIFTRGSRKEPERRVIQVGTGNAITYAATTYTPEVGYRVRTLPKMVLQIKGGAYGDINGRDWTTLYTDVNTWQTSATVNREDHGVALCIHQLSWVDATSLVATITQFSMRNPPAITGNIGARYLHIGTQEVDSQEPDIDCIVRKVGSHFQLDFFPDTKALWGSGQTLELRYKDREKQILDAPDLDSIREVARVRGHELTGTETQQELIRLGGRALDSIELLPTPLSDLDAISQSDAILSAVSSPAYTVEIATNTHLDQICQAGQTIKSTMPGVPDLEIQRVELTEIPGAMKADGSSLYKQRIIAGTADRLSEILQKRVLSSAGRLVLDDGVTDDTFTRIQKVGVKETALASDDFEVFTCDAPTTPMLSGGEYTLLRCLRIPTDSELSTLYGPSFDDAENSIWLAII